jgi:phage terminase Nu1 subunit (DNA packaging protein)
MSKPVDGTVSVEALARLFDCTPQLVTGLAREGIVIKAGRGKYQLATSIRNYVRHLRDRASGRRGKDGSVDAITEGALLKREQRKNYELKNAVLSGSAIPVEAIEPAWSRVVRAGRMAVLAAPARIRFRLPHLSDSDQAVIEEELREQLESAGVTDGPPTISIDDDDDEMAG